VGIARVFGRAQKQGRLALIPYIMAGDPDVETSQRVLDQLARAGADLVELGIPYGDPLADGTTIARAGQRALKSGTTVAAVLALAKKSPLPVILFGYFNPIMQFGIDGFAQACEDACIVGVIVPDVALEEGQELRAALLARGIKMPLLVAPTTRPPRIATICEQASGFVYVVSRLGVTGRSGDEEFGLRQRLAELRSLTDLPLAVGFGIRTPDDVRRLHGQADGTVVGSALIDAYADVSKEKAAQHVYRLAKALREACEG